MKKPRLVSLSCHREKTSRGYLFYQKTYRLTLW